MQAVRHAGSAVQAVSSAPCRQCAMQAAPCRQCANATSEQQLVAIMCAPFMGVGKHLIWEVPIAGGPCCGRYRCGRELLWEVA
eukprot:366124-Chlamydomonas_euryale.AAC.8